MPSERTSSPGPPGIGELVRALFAAGRGQTDVENSVSASIDGFLGAPEAGSAVDFDALSEHFRGSRIPGAPGGVVPYLDLLRERVVAHSVNTSSPNYMGHMTSALPYFMRPLSRLVTALNQNVVKVETAKSLTPYEREAIAMMHRLVFRRDDAFYVEHVQDRTSTLGIVTSGGTIANVTAMWVARNAAFGPDGAFSGVERAGLAAALEHHRARRAVVVGSSLMHYSLEKSADVLGLGTDALVRVPVGPDGRARVEEFRRAVEACHDRGDRVIAIVGVAGTTDSGATDPLVELGSLARELGVHFHVDAAWGGPLLFSRLHRHKLDGIDLADSVTIDGHKQLYLPMGIGMVLLREPKVAQVIEKQARYIIRAGSSDLGRRALEGSRPAVALYLHAALHVIGADGYAWLIDEGIRKASWMADRICKRGDFELLGYPQMNIVNYRYVPAELREKARARTLSAEEQARIGRLNERLQECQRDAGKTFASRTTLFHTVHGSDVAVTALRAVLANPLTTETHIESMLNSQAELALSLTPA